MTLIEMLSNDRVKEVLNLLKQQYPNDKTVVLLCGRYADLKRQETLGMIPYEQKTIENNKLRGAILEFLNSNNNQIESTMENSVTAYLKSIIQDTKIARLKPEIHNKAKELLNQFTNYESRKSEPGQVYDSSGRIWEMLNTAYQNFKTELSESNKDSKEGFEQIVNSKIGHGIPSWDTIKEVYDIACGRGYSNSFIDRNLNSRVNDDIAKLECVDLIINWTKNYLK